MAETIKKSWLQDKDGVKLAPPTTIDNVFTSDGSKRFLNEYQDDMDEIKSEIDSALDNHCIDYYDEIVASGVGIWTYKSLVIDPSLYKDGDVIKLYVDGDITYSAEDQYCIDARANVNGVNWNVINITKQNLENGLSLNRPVPDNCDKIEFRFYYSKETSMSRGTSIFRKVRIENETRANQKIYIKENVNLIRNEDYIKLDTNKLDKSGGTITGDLSVNGTTTIGNATLQYDSTNNCLKFNFNTTSTASTLSLEDEVIV